MDRSRGKVEMIIICILASKPQYYSLLKMKVSFLIHYSSAALFQERNVLANTTNELHNSSATTWRVCTAPTILFWLQLRGGFTSCPNRLNISSIAQAPRVHSTGCRSLSETILLPKQTSIVIPTHSYMLPLLPDHLQRESFKSWWKRNLAGGRFLSDQQVSLTPPWLQCMAELVQMKWQEHITKGVRCTPTNTGSTVLGPLEPLLQS